MPALKSLIPGAETLIAMHPADLAGYMLEVLLSLDKSNQGQWNRRNFCMEAGREYSPSVRNHGLNQPVSEACAETWTWLESNWLICRHPEKDNDWYMPTRRGKALRDKTGVKKLVEAEQLPDHFLHESMLADVRPLFLQGRYDNAVFQAFHTLEVTIREAAELDNSLLGTKLAGVAFDKETGALTDKNAEPAERVALRNLMAGAIGSYKNPQSHRHVGVTAPEAREMILLASHLMKIVESRQESSEKENG